MIQPVRVLLLLDNIGPKNWGGVQTMTQTLLLALQERGLVTTALPWQGTKLDELIHAARQSDILIASHNFGPTYCGVTLKTLTRKPLVSWVHGPLLDVLEMSKASWWRRQLLKRVYGYVDRFVCVSHSAQYSLLGFVSPNRTVVIPNGLAPLVDDVDAFVSDMHTSSLTNLRLGYIGRLSREKRPHLLIETLRCLPIDAHLSLVGDGVLRLALEDAGKDLIANGRLRFLGHQVSSRSLYTPYQVTLLTSKFEGCPMTALESLSCGVPCVGLPIPALRELFAQHAPYLLAQDETPQALAIAILNLLSMSKKQVHKDMARIVAKHSLSNFADCWESAILDLFRNI